MNGLCLPGDEDRADDHFAGDVCVVEERRCMCRSDRESRVATGRQLSTRTGCREYMTTRAFRMAKAASGGGGWRRAEFIDAFTTPPSSPSPPRVHVEEHTLDRVFRRHPLPGALQDLMCQQQHSLYGRVSSGNGEIMTMENKNLDTGLRHIYMHRSPPIYRFRLAQITTLTSKRPVLPL